MPTTDRLTSSGSVDLREAYAQVNDRIAAAAERSGRSADEVVMVAVTKYASMDQVRQLVELGHADLGESRAQQLAQRAPQIDEFLSRKRKMANVAPNRSDIEPPERVRWHMIGRLQRNKVKGVVPLVSLIHSVDSLRLADELHSLGNRNDEVIDILMQVNASGETSKGGVAAPAVVPLAEQIDSMLHLRLRGLMTMAPYSDDPEEARPTFRRTAEIFADVAKAGYGGKAFNVLSMGMSGDFEVAIEEGANVVRIGSLLFGEHEEEE